MRWFLGGIIKLKKISKFIKFELRGWNKLEVLWLVISDVIIICLSIYWGDNLMGIISATTGVMYVICMGKGKLSAYIFGLINSVLYSIISYNAQLYGEMMLNALYYVPMQFVGFYTWSKNMNIETAEVNKRKMNLKQRLMLCISIFLCTIIYGIILKYMGDLMPFMDSFTTIASVFAMIVSIKMFTEQWYIWNVVNTISIVMWAVAYVNGNENPATLIMWGVYLINGIIMCIKWEREIKSEEIQE